MLPSIVTTLSQTPDHTLFTVCDDRGSWRLARDLRGDVGCWREQRFLTAIKRNWGITREQIAKEGVYFSHETSTHATPTASCSFNEISALRKCFGDELMAELIIINTKVSRSR